MARIPHIPLQAKELLSFNFRGFLALAVLFVAGLLLTLLIERILKPRTPRRRWGLRVIVLCLYSLLCAAGTYTLSYRQEEARRMRCAAHLASNRDTGAEEIFARIAPADSLPTYLPQALPEYQFYFNLCRRDDSLLIGEETFGCEDFFERRAAEGTPTGIEGLTVVDYSFEHYAYLYRLSLGDSLTLNIDMGRRKIAGAPGEKGFHLPSSYSYACYYGPHIMVHAGDFIYPYDREGDSVSAPYFEKKDGYSHLHYPIDARRTLVLSAPRSNPWEILHNFSLFFLIFGIIGSLVFIIAEHNFSGNTTSYKQRLRATVSLAVVGSLAAFTVVGVFFMRGLYRSENEKMLRGQALTLLAEMENRYRDVADLQADGGVPTDASVLAADIEQLSNLFRIGFRCYSSTGDLLFSTPNRIFPPSLDEELMKEAALGQKHLIINKVAVGKEVSALVAVTPFRNVEGKILGYLYLPYFWQNEAWRNEMSGFLGVYLTMMLLLSIVILLLASLLADYITRPLAEREREGAWNEMARQVAHEIKNPLTPMKLQVQQLERAYKDGREDFAQRMEKFTALMTGQIDRLAAIAGAFSQFSKWRDARMEKLRVSEFLRYMQSLYQDACVVSLSAECENLCIQADPKFLEQIFHNLIKNAQQAGATEITIGVRAASTASLKKEPVILYVKDNGPGIPPQTARHIFEPHFTTKTSGAGLGLAICRKLCESMGATIELASSSDTSGACFLISF